MPVYRPIGLDHGSTAVSCFFICPYPFHLRRVPGSYFRYFRSTRKLCSGANSSLITGASFNILPCYSLPNSSITGSIHVDTMRCPPSGYQVVYPQPATFRAFQRIHSFISLLVFSPIYRPITSHDCSFNEVPTHHVLYVFCMSSTL
jgi:hypothetical protein